MSAEKKPRPDHYKIISISMYTKDIELLREKVGILKRRGYSKMNKSRLIRIALNALDIERLDGVLD